MIYKVKLYFGLENPDFCPDLLFRRFLKLLSGFYRTIMTIWLRKKCIFRFYCTYIPLILYDFSSHPYGQMLDLSGIAFRFLMLKVSLCNLRQFSFVLPIRSGTKENGENILVSAFFIECRWTCFLSNSTCQGLKVVYPPIQTGGRIFSCR